MGNQLRRGPVESVWLGEPGGYADFERHDDDGGRRLGMKLLQLEYGPHPRLAIPFRESRALGKRKHSCLAGRKTSKASREK